MASEPVGADEPDEPDEAGAAAVVDGRDVTTTTAITVAAPSTSAPIARPIVFALTPR